jgi:predicted ester cyclase
MMPQTEQNKLIARRFEQEGWGTKPNWEEIWDELMANDVVHHFNSSPAPIMGLEANKAFNASLFQGFPNIQHTIKDMISEGDKVVITRFSKAPIQESSWEYQLLVNLL